MRAKGFFGSLSLALGALLIVVVAGAGRLLGAMPEGISPDAPALHYVCTPCNLPCDDAVYDAPGVCPKCGMALVEQGAAAAAAATHPARKKVAILIFDGVQIIDYTGPYEVFGSADFDVYTVAETTAPVTTAMGMKVVPKHTFADAPQPDVLVVPGGGVRGARDSKATLKWVADTTAHTQHTMSVCNGAFILASAGLLDGLTATTTSGLIEKLRTEYPKTKVVDDRRFVDNGKIITTAGLSSGIDGALHVIAKMLGNGTAQAVALGEEYDWRPRSGFARAALADRLIPHLDLAATGEWTVEKTQGGTDRWELVLRGRSNRNLAALADYFAHGLATNENATNGKWTSVKAAKSASSSLAASDWKLHGRDGRNWTGNLKIQPVSGESHQYTATFLVARAS
jgi:putative intracellular protease/amidase